MALINTNGQYLRIINIDTDNIIDVEIFENKEHKDNISEFYKPIIKKYYVANLSNIINQSIPSELTTVENNIKTVAYLELSNIIDNFAAWSPDITLEQIEIINKFI